MLPGNIRKKEKGGDIMEKGKKVETTIKITGGLDSATQKVLDDIGANIKSIERATKETTRSAKEMITVINSQSKALEKIQLKYTDYALKTEQSSKGIQELSREIQGLSKELNQNSAALNVAERAANSLIEVYDRVDDSAIGLKNAAKSTKKGFSGIGGAVSNLASKGKDLLISKAGEAVNTLLNLSTETQAYRENMGKLKTTWESAGASTDLATETYKEFYGILGEEDRSVEAVSHLSNFVNTEKEMQQWTDIAAGVWGTYGDALPIEDLTEAANETAKVGEVTGPLADALASAGVSEDKFNKRLAAAGSEQARAALITETLSQTYSEAAQNYKENNGSIIDARKATAEFTDAQAALGAKMEPLTTQLTQLKTKALEKIIPFVSMIITKFTELGGSVFPKIIGYVQEYVIPIVSSLANILSGVLGAAFAALKPVIAGLLEGLNGVITFLRGIFTANWTDIWNGIVSIFSGIFNALAGILKIPINAVISIINKVISMINGISFDLPEFLGGGHFGLNIPEIPLLAKGGFTKGVSIAGEEGMEAVLSFNPAYRNENISYWAKAGRMLGVTTEDFSLSDSSGGNTSVDLGGVSFSPTVNVSGNAGTGDIVKAIKAEYPEFLDMLERWLIDRKDLLYA